MFKRALRTRYGAVNLRISLRGRILMIVAALTLLSMGGGLFSVWFAWSTNRLMGGIVETGFANLNAARELDTALMRQRGYLGFYHLDRDKDWLERLEIHDSQFKSALVQAYAVADLEHDRAMLGLIEAQYIILQGLRGESLTALNKNDLTRGQELRGQANGLLEQLMELTSAYERAGRKRIDLGWLTINSRIDHLTRISLTGVVLVVLLGVILALVLLGQVLGPIRRLALDGGPFTPAAAGMNEVAALRRRVVNLWENFDKTQNQLALSREQLLQAAKLASVGKLAAGVAHSIRNPLTAVKMRLFSLERALERDNSLTGPQKQDLTVIAQEITNVDTIVTNFLEFSRRPKLNLKETDPVKIIESCLALLRQRLESYRVEVFFEKPAILPLIKADPDQLREVLVNLIVNACEAITDPGRKDAATAPAGKIRIRAVVVADLIIGQVLRLDIQDNGPGIPAESAENVFNPFFTTREEGTGLGLSIALRIIEEHGGTIDLLPVDKDSGPVGTRFIIHLPVPVRADSTAGRLK